MLNLRFGSCKVIVSALTLASTLSLFELTWPSLPRGDDSIEIVSARSGLGDESRDPWLSSRDELDILSISRGEILRRGVMLLVRLGSVEGDLPRAFVGLSDRCVDGDWAGDDKLTEALLGFGDDKRRLRCTEDLRSGEKTNQDNSQRHLKC